MGRRRRVKLRLLNRVMAEIHREWRKATVLGVLVVVLLVVGGRELVVRLRPSRAAADTPARPGAAAPAAGDQAGAAAPSPAGGQDEEGRSQLNLGRLVVDRDLFVPSPLYFPPNQTTNLTAVVRTVGDPNQWEDAAGRTIRAQAQALSLQSTMVGDVPTAIVNGQVLRVGDWINGFEVVEIHSRTCSLEKEKVRVILEMAQ